jgi:hypothetical protein
MFYLQNISVNTLHKGDNDDDDDDNNNNNYYYYYYDNNNVDVVYHSKLFSAE